LEGWNTLERLEYGSGRLEYSTVKQEVGVRCRRLEYSSVQVEGWNSAGWRLFYIAGGRVEDLENNAGGTGLKYWGGRLEYCAERLEYGAGRLDYSTVKVEGWSTMQEKGWSAVQGGWSLYSARRRLEHGAGVRLEYGIQVEGYGTGAGRPEYCKIHVEGWSTQCRWKRLKYYTGESWNTVQVGGWNTLHFKGKAGVRCRWKATEQRRKAWVLYSECRWKA
jgi:hypothetical protein